jgi:hypothetical protein
MAYQNRIAPTLDIVTDLLKALSYGAKKTRC